MLKASDDKNLAVYAIWFSMYPNDGRDKWPPDALSDPRVLHYWDEGKVLGGWYGERLADIQGQMAAGSRGFEGPVLWDAFLVYGPESRWEAAPTGLRQWGRTILATRDALRDTVEGLGRGAASN